MEKSRDYQVYPVYLLLHPIYLYYVYLTCDLCNCVPGVNITNVVYSDTFIIKPETRDVYIYSYTLIKTGMFVTYEISPLMVEVAEHKRSFTHFLTGVCAIIGGVFTGL